MQRKFSLQCQAKGNNASGQQFLYQCRARRMAGVLGGAVGNRTSVARDVKIGYIPKSQKVTGCDLLEIDIQPVPTQPIPVTLTGRGWHVA
jgi:hypothetical protein